jgi:hypothetical protein
MSTFVIPGAWLDWMILAMFVPSLRSGPPTTYGDNRIETVGTSRETTMLNSRRDLLLVVSLAAMLPTWGQPPARRQSLDAPPPTVLINDDPGLQMTAKLIRSTNILEGLVRRDFDAVSRAAQELKRISAATNWPYDNSFHVLNVEFQQQCDQLDSLARTENYEGIQHTFQNMTMTCIRCHDHVRDTLQSREVPPDGSTRLLRPHDKP